jgi:DNA polymerase alpha subunit B
VTPGAPSPGGGAAAADVDDGEGDADTRRFELPAPRALEAPYKYMYATPAARAEALEDRLAEVGDAIVAAHSLGALVEPVGTVSQGPLVYVGRVCTDGEGKINATSVLLEGSARGALAAGLARANPSVAVGRVLLDLRELPSFSLFPGQIVAVRGLNTQGERMVVHAVYTAPPMPLGVLPRENYNALADAHSGAQFGAPLRLAVACGPYNLAADDSWTFKPLEHMLSFLHSSPSPPDVIVLVRVERARLSSPRARRIGRRAFASCVRRATDAFSLILAPLSPADGAVHRR